RQTNDHVGINTPAWEVRGRNADPTRWPDLAAGNTESRRELRLGCLELHLCLDELRVELRALRFEADPRFARWCSFHLVPEDVSLCTKRCDLFRQLRDGRLKRLDRTALTGQLRDGRLKRLDIVQLLDQRLGRCHVLLREGVWHARSYDLLRWDVSR